MKYFKNLLLICCLSFFLFGSEDEETRVVTVDGIVYKADPSSGHLTPLNATVQGNNVMSEVKDIKESASSIATDVIDDETYTATNSGRKFYANIGQMNPLGDPSDLYDTGSSIGFSMPLPNTNLTIFGKNFSTGVEINLSNFGKIGAGNDLKVNSAIFHLITTFGNMPVDFDFGLALTHHSTVGLGGSGMLDISYNLPIDKIDLSVVLRVNKLIDVKDGFELDFDALDSYGLYLKYGQPLNF